MGKFTLIKLFMLLFPIGTVITGNLIGTLKKQIGKSLVYATWKGINYMRRYVVPANPNTVAQQAQRGLFSWVQRVANSVLITVCQKFWKKLAVKMSAYNAFMKYNLKSIANVDSFVGAIFAKGSMLASSGHIVEYTALTGAIACSWNIGSSGNQTDNDTYCVVICDESTSLVVDVFDSATKRVTGAANTIISAGLIPANLKAFCFFYRGLGTVNECIETSQFVQVT